MATLKNKSILLLTLVAALGLAACNDNNAESAGEQIDELMTDTGNAVEDACENIKEGLKAKNKDC